MRTPLLVLLVGLFLAACGGDSVDDHLDALREDQDRYCHNQLPSTARWLELNPEETDAEWRGEGVRERLLRTTEGRALLDAGSEVVPELALRLDDPRRGLVAASVLTEIGNEEAARALLRTWRRLRAGRKTVHVYRARGTALAPRWFAEGHRYEGVDGGLYGEVLAGLAYSGRPVSAEIASDTVAALEASGALAEAGKPLRSEEEDEKERRVWHVGPAETAVEGLRMLAMMGAPEATAIYRGALATPVGPFRFNAIRDASWLGLEVMELVPLIATLLDDPDLRAHALKHLHEILELPGPPEGLTEKQQEEAAADLRVVLRERGLEDR